MSDLPTWQSQLSGAQAAWLEFCLLNWTRADAMGLRYAGDPELMALVVHMSRLLIDTPPPLPPPPPRSVLAVPYHSQWEADALLTRKDCGPACVEMVCEFYKGETGVTTDDIMRFITGGSDRGTYISELQRAAQEMYGVTLARHNGVTWDQLLTWVDLGHPVIVLVHYGSFLTRIDRNYTGGHYMVVMGYDSVAHQEEAVPRVLLHDPDFYGIALEQGAEIPVVRDHFMDMWTDASLDGNPVRMALVAQE